MISEDLSITQWTSVLRLTALWQMDGLTKTVLQTRSSSKISRENWLVLLDVSAQYQLPEVRTFAIRELSSTFTGPIYERKTVFKICRAREQYHRDLVNKSLFRFRDWDAAVTNAAETNAPVNIETEFGSELDEMENDSEGV